MEFEEIEKVCREIIVNGDLSTLSIKKILRQAEEKLGLEYKELSTADIKQKIEDLVDRVLAELESKEDPTAKENENVASESEGEGAGAEENEEEEEEEEQEEEEEEQEEEQGKHTHGRTGKPKVQKKKSDRVVRTNVVDSEDEHFTPSKERKREKKGNQKSTDKAESGSGDKWEKTIKTLKSYVNKCGIRVNWSKAMAEKSKKQQADYLRELLKSNGIEGRPSLAKCAQIKAKLELQRELQDIDPSNIINTKNTSKRPKRKAGNEWYSAALSNDNEDADTKVKEKKHRKVLDSSDFED